MSVDSTPPADGGNETAARPRPLRALLQALYAVALIALASAALKGWHDHQRAAERERALEAEISATEARISALKLRIDRLQNDPATLDRVAREELGLVKPDEVVIMLPGDSANPAGFAATDPNAPPKSPPTPSGPITPITPVRPAAPPPAEH